jgi:beta-lactamase regulating signal transducer with metallopeptidase domain
MSLSWTTAAGWLVHCAFGGGILLLLTCLLIRRTRQPARRQRLGELGLAAALVLAVLSLRPPWLVLPWPVPGSPEPPAARAEAPAPEELPGDDLVIFGHPFVEAILPGPAAVEPPPEAALAPPAPDEPADPWWQSLLALLPWLVVAHAVCAALLLARWLLGHYALARLLRGAVPAPAAVARLFKVMVPRRLRARLLVARGLRVPLSFGLLRPTVVLPASLCDPPDLQKLRWVFAHELTHLERRDAWSALLFALGQAVYFFLPWFGWLRRQVRLCQEYVADAAAADQEDPAVDYAEFLLSLTGAPAVPAAAASVSGNCSDLYRRVTMLLKEPMRVEKRCPRRWSLAAAAGLFALAILVGGVGLRADAAQVVVIVPAPDGKPAQPGQDKDVRVIVVPRPGGARVGKEADQVRKVIIANQAIAAKPAQPVQEERVKVIREAIVNQLAPVQRELLFDLDRDGRLEEVRKILLKLEQQPGAAEIEAVRKDIRKVLGEIPGRAGVRAVQREVDIARLQRKGAEQGTEAALKALRKALDKLGERPELEGARQQLKMAIEQLEKARRQGNLNFFGPGFQLNPEAGKQFERWFAAPGKGAQAWGFDPKGGGFWAGPGKQVDAELLKKIREELKNKNFEKAEDLLKKALEGAQGQWQFNFNPGIGREKEFALRGRGRTSGRGSLGVSVEKPSAALADQLNLPAGKGLIITAVKADSPAAKAGLKVNDVLLEVNGQPVSSDSGALTRALDKARGEPASAVVLRKGKRETIKGISLGGAPGAGKGAPERAPEAGRGRRDATTNVVRSGDRFTTSYQEGSLRISLTGTIADGKAKASEIRIQDGRESHRSDSIERVPAQYRDQINRLLELSGGGAARKERSRP